MKRFELTDEILNALFWLRARELKAMPTYAMRMNKQRPLPTEAMLYRVLRMGLANCYRPRRMLGREIWSLTPTGRGVVNAVIEYEKDNPRYSAEEGPSAVLYGDCLLSWSYRTAVYEIENLRRMRQTTEERKAARSGRKGCHETRCRAEPRPAMAICVDDCRHGKGVR